MLIIRQDQMDVFEAQALTVFEKRIEAHLRRFFPEEYQELEDSGVLEFIEYGIEHANSYGIESEKDVCKYIDIMVAYGRDFDRDRNLAWAHQILEDESILDPQDRINRLSQKAIEYWPEEGENDVR